MKGNIKSEVFCHFTLGSTLLLLFLHQDNLFFGLGGNGQLGNWFSKQQEKSTHCERKLVSL